MPSITKKNIKATSLQTIIDNECDAKYSIDGKMKITEKVWNDFLNILNDNTITIPKFPIWTDWWDSDGNNTSVTKHKPKLTEEENKSAICLAVYVSGVRLIDNIIL